MSILQKFNMLDIIDTRFLKSHFLNKGCNKNKVRVSYSCMPDIKTTMNNRNLNISPKITKLKMGATTEIKSKVL